MARILRTLQALLFIFVLCVFVNTAHSTPFWATNFGLPGVNGTVNAIAETPDAFYYAGSFTSVGNVTANNIVRVDKATGAVTPLGSVTQNGVAGTVEALAVIGTDLYVGGSIIGFSSSTQNNVIVNGIAKWDNAAGTWSFLGNSTKNGVAGGVYALATNGTDLYVGGSFSTVNSSTQNAVSAVNVAKWDTLAGAWSALGNAAQNGTNSNVRALAMSGTNLYVGGFFTMVSSSTQTGIAANGVAKWDTTAATWSPLGSATQNGVSNGVWALATMGSNLYVAGVFNTVSSSTQNAISARSIAKWDMNAGAWSPLGSATQNGLSYGAYALAVNGTDLYVGGYFSQVSSSTQNAIAVNSVAKWDTIGGTWSLLGGSTQNGVATAGLAGATVNALVVSGSNLLVGGNFTSAVGMLMTSGTATWSITGNAWNAAVPATAGDGISGLVNTTLDAGPVIYVGGSFSYAGNVAANNVACWNKSTRTWSALGTAGQNGTSGPVYALTMIGTELFVGGSFTTVSSGTQNGISAKGIAIWDTNGAAWSPLGSSSQNGTNQSVYALATIGTDLYVAGTFTTVSSSTQNAFSAKTIAKWDTLGSTWSRLGSGTQNGTNTFVYALAVNGTDLYVGGSFTTVSSSTQNAISAKGIAKWSTTGSTWSPLGSATQNGISGATFGTSAVGALVLNGTSLYVGGSFTTVSSTTQNAITANNIAAWDLSGNTWSPFGGVMQNGVKSTFGATGINVVNVMMLNGTDLLVGGSFSTASSGTQNGITAQCIAKWDTTANVWSSFGNPALFGINGNVKALSVSGTDLYLGGQFTLAGFRTSATLSSSGIAIYGLEPVITVRQGSTLTDGAASVAFGSVNVGISATPLTFTISNTGSANLTLGTIGEDGANPGDFTVSAVGNATVAPGSNTTFTITFTPSSEGARSAAIHIASNVNGTTNPFDIALTGLGDDTPPVGGTMTLTPGSPVNTNAALQVNFTNWTDPSTPLSYVVLVDDVVVSAKNISPTPNITGPATPGLHTLKGRIYDTANNYAEVTQSFTVNTAQESWRLQFYGTTANAGNAADNADPYGTGVQNLTVFALLGPNQDPAKAAPSLLPQVQVSGGNLVISFVQPSGVNGVTYGAEACADLATGSWASVPDTGSGAQHIFSVPAGSSPQLFLRLTITSP